VTSLTSSDHVIVVGAGLSGWRLVESLRNEGFDGAITLIGDEVHLPYDRPPLSKQVLSGKWDLAKASLATHDHVVSLAATLRLGARVTHLDVENTSVTLADSSVVRGSRVAIATGCRARELRVPSYGVLPTLRNRDDVDRLNEALGRLSPASVVAIVGGGFVGAEVATSLRARGFTPVVVEAAARPLIGVLGDEVSMWLLRLASDAGVELRTNHQLKDVTEDDAGYHLTFDDGTTLDAGAVLAAVGSSLDLDWLNDSGLHVDNGVVVDNDLQAASGVAAIGDVARFPWSNAAGEELVRIEHWQVATDHAAQLADFWMGGGSDTTSMVPYFWSDQYDKKLQLLGHPRPSDDVVCVSGSPEEGKWLALYSRNSFVTGVVTLSQPRGLALSRGLLESPTTLDEALAAAPWST
jgi:3-phenylpropionate/trans-cinnamate dioxygenase ferredoxin reductase component